MGALFSFSDSADLNLTAVDAVFAKKRMGPRTELRAGGRVVWVLAKTLQPLRPSIDRTDADNWLASAGTLIYGGRGLAASLTALHTDLVGGRVEWSRLKGSFALMWAVGGELTTITDVLGVQPLFEDEQETVSTSFLAVLVSSRTKRTINETAFLEKVATGYVIGPETLVHEIRRDGGIPREGPAPRTYRRLRPPKDEVTEVQARGTRRAAAWEQLEHLRCQLSDLHSVAVEEKAVLAVSGGYDSRLLLAALLSQGLPPSLQTHASEGSHDHEVNQAIVRGIALKKDLPLIVVPTRVVWKEEPESLQAALHDGLYFFDGRNSFNMGAFSSTYTHAYAVASLGGCGVRLNGLGGEIYRNYYSTARRRVDFHEWTLNKLLYRTALRVIRDESAWREVFRSRQAKIENVLGARIGGSVDQRMLRRYHAEVRMPHCYGAVNNAHNQVASFLTPFVDWETVRKAYEAGPLIGLSGRFQAEMIELADTDLAHGLSHHGFPPAREPIAHRLKAAIKGYVPDTVWNVKTRMGMATGASGGDQRRRFEGLRENHSELRALEECLRDWYPKLVWEESYRNYSHVGNVVFLGSFLREFGGGLRHG